MKTLTNKDNFYNILIKIDITINDLVNTNLTTHDNQIIQRNVAHETQRSQRETTENLCSRLIKIGTTWTMVLECACAV